MGIATSTIKPNRESLLRAIRKLSPDELDEVLAQLHRLRASQRKQTLPKREAALLQSINSVPPAASRTAYRRLEAKRQAETLTPTERRELLRLSDELELLNAERVRSLVALAALRRITVSELMTSLDLETLANA
jgi:hypothetical protein